MSNVVNVTATMETMLDGRKRLRHEFDQKDKAIADALADALRIIEQNSELESSRIEREAAEQQMIDARSLLIESLSHIEDDLTGISHEINLVKQDAVAAVAVLQQAPARLELQWRALIAVAREIGQAARAHPAAWNSDRERQLWVEQQIMERLQPITSALTVGSETAPHEIRRVFGFRSYVDLAIKQLIQAAGK